MNHPTPKAIAAHLRAVANLIDSNGHHALELADALSARGYPTTTQGSASRSADETTSVERAAGANNDTPPPPDRWATANTDLDRIFSLLTRTAHATEDFMGLLFDHASDQDWLPAGSGNCLCCTNFVRPDHKHPDRRLRSGFCPACHQAWLRWRQHHYPDRAAFVRDRRADLLRRAEERGQKHRIGA